MYKFLFAIFLVLIPLARSEGVIYEIDQIEKIRSEIDPDTLVFFNIAEVLTDSSISLGTQAWRKYLRKKVDSKTHDEITLYVFKNVPSKPVESITPQLIIELQEEENPVFALTSRGRNEWYKSTVPHVDVLTESVLLKLNMNFSKTLLPTEFADIDKSFSTYFHKGIFYTGNTIDKGDFLTELFQKTKYTPSKMVIVDDKRDSLEEVEKAFPADIPFVGFAYNRTALDHKDFDPMIANIQLDYLISYNKLLTDAEALQVKEKRYSKVDPNTYFDTLISKWKTLGIK